MAHYVVTSERGTDTVEAWSEDDAAEAHLDAHNVEWDTYGDWPFPVTIRPATVREALVSKYGDDWERSISHVLSTDDRRVTTRIKSREGYPSFDVDYVPLVALNHTRGRDVFGYEDAVEVSNYRVLRDRWSDIEGLSDGPWSNCSVIALDLDSPAPADFIDVVEQLESYPVLDEDEWSRVEQEMIQEQWDSYGKSDVARAVEKAIDPEGETYGLTDAAEAIIAELVWSGILDYGPGGGYPTMIYLSACDFGGEAVAAFISEHLGQVVTVKRGNGYGDAIAFDLTRENLLES